MASDFPSFPPGIGVFRPDDRARPDEDHLAGFNRAIQKALENFGRAPGLYRADVALSATIEAENPGYVVEYIARII